MIRDFAMAILLLSLALMPVAAASEPAARAVCSSDGVRWEHADRDPVQAPAGPEQHGCAHHLCPGRERRSG